MLSDNDAMATGSPVSPTGTSIASAYGTRTRSAMKPPPSSPARGAMPYIAINGNDAHEPVTPRRHAGQLPQLIWNGTITRSPTFTSRTASPTATTSATPSCPTACPGGIGNCPSATATSRSQHATATGRTMACSGAVISGSGASRQAYSPAASNISCCMTDLSVVTFLVLLNDLSSKVKTCLVLIEAG